MKKILLVNPWIYDFAAYDFGIKPMGLLRIAESLRREGNIVHLVDCLQGSSARKDAHGFSKFKKTLIPKPDIVSSLNRPYFRYGMGITEFIDKLKAFPSPEVIYVTSGMTYWYPGVSATIKLLKGFYGNIPVVLGGIYATLCPKHATKYSGADFLWKGDYLPKNTFTKKGFYPAYDLLEDTTLLPIQLTRGCPYKCTYCAVGSFNKKFQMRDPIDLFEEIMHYNNRFGTTKFVFYDDALTFRSEKGLKKLLRLIIASRKDLTFLTPNGLHARFVDYDLAYLLKRANFKEVRISLETSDEDLQLFTGAKVSNDEIKTAIRNLKEAGFTKNDLGVYLLIGAPWLPLDKTIHDVKFVNSLGSKAILASYSPIPGSKDFRAMQKNGILKKGTDPLWHNKSIFSELLAPSYMDKIQQVRRLTAKLNKL